MKVATICNLPPSYGGAEVLAKELILKLHGLGVPMHVVTHRRCRIQLVDGLQETEYSYVPAQHKDILNMGIEICPVFESTLSAGAAINDSPDRRFVESLVRLVTTWDVDVLHCHFTTGKIREAFHVSQTTNKPLVVTYHGMTNLESKYDSFVYRNLDKEEHMEILRASACNVVVSDEMLRYCHDRGIENVLRISGGVDQHYFHDGGNGPRCGILYVGKLNRHKGLKEICQAYVRLSSFVDEPLYLVGRGTDRDNFQRTGFFLDDHELLDFRHAVERCKVVLKGELPPGELREYYRTAKVLVLPSLTEGFPLSVLEALACGTPVVASNVGSVVDVVRNGHNGFTVPKGCIEELVTATLGTIASFEKMNPNCRPSIEGFTSEEMAGEYRSLFTRLAGG